MSRRRIALYALGAALALLFGGRWIAIQYTKAAWFTDLGRAGMFWSRFGREVRWQLAVAVGAALWYAAQTFAVYRSIGAVHLPRRVGNLEINEEVPRRALRWVAIGIAVVLGVVTAATFTDLPALVALYRSAAPLGFREPVLGHDASFYLARLPLLETLHLAALLLVLFGAFVSTALYVMTGSITLSGRRLRMTPHARIHLVILLGLLGLVVAWGFQLDSSLIVGGGGSLDGALSLTDRAIRLPACTALAALALVVAAVTVATLRHPLPRLLVAIWSTLAVAAVLGRFVVPYLAGAWGGRPDPQIAAGLAQYADRYSRAGLGVLGGLEAVRLPLAAAVPAGSLAALGHELSGLSPWNAAPGLLPPALDAAVPDSGRPRVWTATLDRFDGPHGIPKLAVLAVPEPDQFAVQRGARPPDWTALHRGAFSWAGAPVVVSAGPTATGALHFFSSLTPLGDSSLVPPPLALAPGHVRYVAHAADPAVVGPDEPAPPGGPAGLRLGGMARRLLFAWALQSAPLLGRATSVADRLLVWRDVPRRLARLFPFATFTRPRAVVADGRLLWVADGMLASARFPLAAHVTWDGEAVNYLRPAYVVTVDAVSGATRLYLRPPDLRFAAQLAAGMGARPLPSDSLSPAIRAHLDYPPGLLLAQAEMLARHRGDTGAAARRWEVAVGTSDSAGRPRRPRPTVALLALDAGPRRLWSLLPLADDTGTALVAFVAATIEPDGQPALRLLRLPHAAFPTPAAAASRISLSPAVVGAMAQLSGPDGSVRRSEVIAVPAAGTVAYIQFVFATTHTGAPLLPRAVAVFAGGRVGVGNDAAGAVGALATSGESAAMAASSEATLSEARAAFRSLDSAVRAGDWARFGRAYESLRRALQVGSTAARRP